MVAPVTGPFERTVNQNVDFYGNIVIGKRWYRKWYRQRKPYDLPLLYNMSYQSVDYFHDPHPPNYRNYTSAGGITTGDIDQCRNKVWNRLKEELGSQSLWATNLAEMGKTMDLIIGPATTLTRAARQIRKFDFKGAAKTLNIGQPPKGLKKDAKFFGDNFLKFHFGIAPLVEDIGNAIDTLQNPYPSKRVKASAAYSSNSVFGSIATYTYITSNLTRCRSSVEVSVSNPNLFLANQLGFVNPAAFVWEAIPFSFVVDWFVNVGQVLSSMTDFAGVTLVKPQSTWTQYVKKHELWYNGIEARYTSFFLDRQLTLFGPIIRPRPWKGVSTVRAATAISLLVQQLR
jgi:hypothetical protein